MDTIVVMQQMFILFIMLMTGYFTFKKGMLDTHVCHKLTTLIVTIFNPLLVINGVLNKDSSGAGSLIVQNFILIFLMFFVGWLASFAIVRIMRLPKEDWTVFRMMTIFTNLGFMGIPVIASVYGQDAVIYAAFYMLVNNVLLYTYAIWLICKGTGSDVKFDWKKLANPGVAACLTAIVIFAFQIRTPAPVNTLIGYMGEMAVPLSMMMIGATVAQADLKSVFTDVRIYVFSFLRLLVLPILTVLVIRILPFDRTILGVFVIMFSMPVGTFVSILAEEYGADNKTCSRGIVMTTILSLITLPIVTLFV